MMIDDPKVSAMIEAHYLAMTPRERLEIAASMFDTARAIVDSSLSPGLSREERQYAIANRSPRATSTAAGR